MGHGIGNTLWANACMFPLSGQLDLGQILSHHGHGNGHIFGSIGIYFSSLLMCFKMVHLFRFSHEWHSTYTWQITIVLNALAHGLVYIKSWIHGHCAN